MRTFKACGGTPPRHAWEYQTEPEGEVTRVKYEKGKRGCGQQVEIRQIETTVPAGDGDRPLFTKTAPVVICPHCDGPSPAPGDVPPTTEA